MKIVALGPVYPYRGGIAAYHTLLTLELAKKHEVLCVSYSRQYPGWLYPGQSDKDLNQKKPPFPIVYLLDTIVPWSWLKTAQWICQQEPDLVIIEWWVTFLAPAYWSISRYCRQKGIKVLFNIHNVFPHEGGWIHRPIAAFALRQSDYHLTHTPAQAKSLLDLLPHANVRTCPLPVFPAADGPLTQDERVSARQKLGLPMDARVLLFFGIVRAYKGLMVLFEAVAILKEEGVHVYLLVAGEFWDKKEIYLSAMKRLGIADHVRLEDHYIPEDQVRKYFAVADLAVAPYTGGTQSAIVSLAYGFGIPLVMTYCSAAGLDIQSLDAQTIAPPGDARGLAQAIVYSLDNPNSKVEYLEDGWHDLIETIEGFME